MTGEEALGTAYYALRHAATVRLKAGLSGGPDAWTAYVALVGEPYPIRVETGTGVGSADFLDYGRPVTITAPPPAQVAEFAALPTS